MYFLEILVVVLATLLAIFFGVKVMKWYRESTGMAFKKKFAIAMVIVAFLLLLVAFLLEGK